MTLRRVWMPSPNYSSRGGATVRLIVIHASEGATTFRSLGNFFANPSSGVSSHTGIDNTPNEIGEYVNRSNKAWTAANANPVSVQTELCTPSGASANWSRADWNRNPVMLQNCAAWIAEEAAAYGIPIVRLTAAQAQSNGRGVCQHSDLGAWGGGHYDCGPNFPIDDVIAMAAGGGTTPPTKAKDMGPAVCIAKDNTPWYFTMGTDGQVWANAGGDNNNFWSIGGGGELDKDSGPDAAVQTDGRIIVTARGTGGDVRVNSRDPGDGKWTGWWSMGGK